MFGSAPPATAQPLIQAGLANYTSNASSQAVITWPVAFPNGVIAFTVTDWSPDTSNQLRAFGASLTTGSVVVRNDGGGGVGVSSGTLSYIVIGW